MTFKLLVTKSGESKSPDEYVYDQPVVTIGRESSNHLTLPDPTRVVSKRHAKIEQTSDGFQVTDLGSKNFTFLNGERLRSNQAYPLQAGDTLRMGDFELTFQQEAAPVQDFEETVFAAGFRNPFEDDAQELADILERMRFNFEREAPSRREDALAFALEQAFGSMPSHALHEQLAETLGVEPSSAPASSAAPPAPEPSPPSPPPAEPAPAPSPRPQPRTVPSTENASASRIDLLIDTLLRMVARMAEAPWRFRHEFIGQTIMQSEESAFIYSGDAEKLRGHLLNPTVSDEEARTRLELLEEALEDLLVHQLALLDGYKASVRGGMQRFLDEVDPSKIEEELVEESPVFRYIRVLARARAAEAITERCATLRSEDWSSAERRIFRPAFIKAYLARMTSSR